MRKLTILLFALSATPSVAEMTANQLEAYDRVLPVLEAQFGGEGRFDVLAECIVTTAKRGELRDMRRGDVGGDPDPKMIAAANKILTRPDVMTCATEKMTAINAETTK